MDISSAAGLNQLLGKGFDSLSKMNTDLKSQIGSFEDLTPENLLNLQFQMGQYNTMVELTSSISKSLSDNLKSIAQKL